MYYYKFKVYFDEVEDFVRDVEILANDTFESFHKLIYDCTGLQGNEFAAFSICDQKWNKQKEITLFDTSDDDAYVDESPDYEDDDQYSTKSNLPKFVMSEALLKDFITDPHQHIMYEYDFMNPKVFYIELQKALQTDNAEGFPRCTYKKEELPKERLQVKLDDPDDLELEDFDNEDELDDLFGDGMDMDDLADLNEFTDFPQ